MLVETDICPGWNSTPTRTLKKITRCHVPADFNFGFDIVDEWAPRRSRKKWHWSGAMTMKRKKHFTFTDISLMSNQAANFFRASRRSKKATVVMLILRRRWEYWICATALHKIGATLIPGSLQLTKKDLGLPGKCR